MIFINIFNNTLRADVKNCISLMPLIAKPSNKLAEGDGSRSEHIKQKKNKYTLWNNYYWLAPS